MNKINLLSVMVLSAFLAQPASAKQPHASSCRVANVSYGLWEEGLGVFGTPDTDDDSETVSFNWKNKKITDVSVGQMSWNTKEHSITAKSSARNTAYSITTDDEAISVKVFASERGVVLIKESEETPWREVATFDCSSTKVVDAASTDDANVTELNKTQLKSLPKGVLDNLNAVDIPFEMGDGYYSIKQKKYYAVRKSKTSKEVVGYLIWVELSYTEGDDTEAIVRFDRNGLRVNRDFN